MSTPPAFAGCAVRWVSDSRTLPRRDSRQSRWRWEAGPSVGGVLAAGNPLPEAVEEAYFRGASVSRPALRGT